jgi:apolipoprotein N-acyltransferase
VWRFGVVLAVVLGSMVYGRKCLNEAEVEPGPRVALVQTNIPQNVKVDDSREARERVRQQYRELIGAAVAARVDLLIWPETSYGDHFVQIDPQMTDDDVRRFCPSDDAPPEQVRKYAAEVRKDLQEFGQSLGTPVLWGLNFERMTVGKRSMYNSAVLVTPGGAISEPYHKIHLVPWGEYLPLADSLPWLHVFTPHASSDYGLDAGSEHVRFRFDRYSFGVLICFEDTLPDAARAYVSSDPVDMLVNISNDGWFRGSSELDAHLAISIFRAVECRRPLVRAVNTGISAIIDANGRVVQVAGSGFGPRKLSTDVVVGAVPLDRRASFYARAGDWLGWSCQYLTAAVLAAGMLVALARRGPRTQKR